VTGTEPSASPEARERNRLTEPRPAPEDVRKNLRLVSEALSLVRATHPIATCSDLAAGAIMKAHDALEIAERELHRLAWVVA
jgi:hypothetical protein